MVEMIRVPLSADEFRPPQQKDLITEAANFLRAHWEEIKPSFQMIAGEAESKHGSLQFDEAACVFKVQKIAAENGFAVLNTVPAAELWKALRRAYKRNTGIAVHQLETQNRRLRLEHHN